MRKWLAALTVGLLLFTGVPATATTITGRVISIADGDTFTIVDAAMKQTRTRLAEIDAPEKAQPYGQKSRWHLSKLVFGKSVNVRVVTIDRYGRTVGRVFQGMTDVNGEMVRSGAAWAYRRYLSDPDLLKLETDARRRGIGLWALQADQIMPPWEFRHGGD